MVGSREESPDWLRTFQAPDRSTFSISSDSDSHGSFKASPACDSGKGKIYHDKNCYDNNLTVLENDGSKLTIDCDGNSSKRGRNDYANESGKKRKTIEGEDDKGEGKEIGGEASLDQLEIHRSASGMSLDSDYFPDSDLEGAKKMSDNLPTNKGTADNLIDGSKKSISSPKISLKTDFIQKSSNGLVCKKEEKTFETEISRGPEDDAGDKPSNCRVSTTLPLVLSDKVHRSKALVECEGDSIDLSGDMGAVGRVVISDAASPGSEMKLDLKGTIYNTSVIPCRTFCIVSFGQSEAKIEAIVNDFVQLKPESNFFDSETMVEGTLEGFSFESDDEADKFAKPPNQPEQNGDNEEIPIIKKKGKFGKSSGTGQKKTTVSKSRLTKKPKKKPQNSKKSKTKK